jgi:hypothetical protein
MPVAALIIYVPVPWAVREGGSLLHVRHSFQNEACGGVASTGLLAAVYCMLCVVCCVYPLGGGEAQVLLQIGYTRILEPRCWTHSFWSPGGALSKVAHFQKALVSLRYRYAAAC